MITSTTVVITDKRKSFTWKGYGLKLRSFRPYPLHVSDKCLPVDIPRCKITVMVSIAGQYDFPENYHPVSAIFWLRCESLCNFVKPVTIEIDHCAKRTNASKLYFVRAKCSQNELPYIFRKLREGVFNQHTSYGVVELHIVSLELVWFRKIQQKLKESTVQCFSTLEKLFPVTTFTLNLW